jgi:hypothetical protein
VGGSERIGYYRQERARDNRSKLVLIANSKATVRDKSAFFFYFFFFLRSEKESNTIPKGEAAREYTTSQKKTIAIAEGNELQFSYLDPVPNSSRQDEKK